MSFYMLCAFQFGTYHFYLPGGGLLVGGGAPHLWWVGLIFVQVVKWGPAKLCPNVRGVRFFFFP